MWWLILSRILYLLFTNPPTFPIIWFPLDIRVSWFIFCIFWRYRLVLLYVNNEQAYPLERTVGEPQTGPWDTGGKFLSYPGIETLFPCRPNRSLNTIKTKQGSLWFPLGLWIFVYSCTYHRCLKHCDTHQDSPFREKNMNNRSLKTLPTSSTYPENRTI